MGWGEPHRPAGRQEVRLSMTPAQRIRAKWIAAELGISTFTLIRRLLMEEWDRTFGGEHATALEDLHKELHDATD